MLFPRCRNNAVLLEDFHPHGFGLCLLHKLAAMGVSKPLLHGGALRDSFMRAAHGADVTTGDYDVRANLAAIPAWQTGGVDGLLRLFLDNGFTLNPDVDLRKKNPEVLQMDDGHGGFHSLVSFRLLYRGMKIDFMADTNFSLDAAALASAADDSFSALAMGLDGKVYADPDFVEDARSGVTKYHGATPEKWRFISEEHVPKLSARYGYEIGLYREDEPRPRSFVAMGGPPLRPATV